MQNTWKENKVAICAIIKDEHQYLCEWIEYHKSIGIEYIYLYEDEGSMSHEDLCEFYPNVHLTIFKDFIADTPIENNKQFTLYNKFIKEYNNKLDYVFFIDLDEFVTFEEGCCLKDLIDVCDKQGAILLPWKYYGANGIIKDTGCNNVLKSFTKSVDIPWPKMKCPCEMRCKSFVKLRSTFNNYMIHHHVHKLAKPVVSFNPDDIYKVCWLNHYITKSWEEWCNRLFDRGQIIPKLRNIDDFFEYNPDMEFLKETDEYRKLKQKQIKI